MKALSLWQPWASLIATGAKCWETRSWGTTYRGPILIHASKSFTRDQRRICQETRFREDLERGGIMKAEDLPLGAFVAMADLVDVVKSDGRYDGRELPYGDFREGRSLWRLTHVQRFQQPLVWRGEQGLYDVPEEVIAWVRNRSPVTVQT